MNRAKIVLVAARKTGMTQKEVSLVFERILKTITKALSEGEPVELRGFGTFKCVRRSARNAVNPRTGEPIKVEAKIIPAFKPSPKLREAVIGVKLK